ncbi:MAG: AAA-associated domain-containing protein, partial [Candidatus Caldarchaeum sp.]
SLAKGKKKILKEQLPHLEPFRTIIELAKTKPKGFNIEDLINVLANKTELVEYTQEPEKLRELILDWLIYSEILSYDGDKGLFKLRMRKTTNSST